VREPDEPANADGDVDMRVDRHIPRVADFEQRLERDRVGSTRTPNADCVKARSGYISAHATPHHGVRLETAGVLG